MKKSISFPVFLIILGFVFLFHNLDLIHIPDFFNLFRKFWPVILIWIGLDKLYRIYIQDSK